MVKSYEEWPRWRQRIHEVIFEADTAAGKAFDIALLLLIVLSVLAVILESVTEIRVEWGALLRSAEWVFTVVFTIEYILRLMCVRKPLRYVFSFFGIVDLLSILPTYLSLLLAGTQSLLVIRALRLMRIFRVLKMAHYLGEADLLVTAMRASGRKIIVFLGFVITLMTILGTCMYLIEGEANGFLNIPQSIYWAVVTMTTVGYGDIAPATPAGKFLASLVMITGYAIIAVPTGIVSAELSRVPPRNVSTQVCPSCSREGHRSDSTYCRYCGAEL